MTHRLLGKGLTSFALRVSGIQVVSGRDTGPCYTWVGGSGWVGRLVGGVLIFPGKIDSTPDAPPPGTTSELRQPPEGK